MRVVAIHAFSYQIREFTNVTSIAYTEQSTTISGTEVGQSPTAGAFILPNSLYMIRIIKN